LLREPHHLNLVWPLAESCSLIRAFLIAVHVEQILSVQCVRAIAIAHYQLGALFQKNGSAVAAAKKIGVAVAALLDSATTQELSAATLAVEQLLLEQLATQGSLKR
jgi:protein-disulfide isomerase-like protein with CxxC motif